MEVDQAKLNAITPKLELAIQKAIEEAGLSGYQVDSIRMAPKSDRDVRSDICKYTCRMVGSFPHTHVFCYFDCTGKQ